MCGRCEFRSLQAERFDSWSLMQWTSAWASGWKGMIITPFPQIFTNIWRNWRKFMKNFYSKKQNFQCKIILKIKENMKQLHTGSQFFSVLKIFSFFLNDSHHCIWIFLSSSSKITSSVLCSISTLYQQLFSVWLQTSNENIEQCRTSNCPAQNSWNTYFSDKKSCELLTTAPCRFLCLNDI